MRKILLLLILVLFFISICSVSAEGNFSSLQDEINNADAYLELNQDYSFNKEVDQFKEDISIYKENFTLNGNGHTIDAKNLTQGFFISANNVTINNITIVNCKSIMGGGVLINSEVNFTLNNVVFINNTASKQGGAVYCAGNCTFSNIKFIDNYADSGGASVFFNGGTLNLDNCIFTNSKKINMAQIMSSHSWYTNTININNCIFANTTSKYATAIYNDKNTNIRNTRFENLYASETGGAIIIKNSGENNIENCTFINTKSEKNGGAIFADFDSSAEKFEIYYLNITNSSFINSSSGFGGAIVCLDGYLYLNNSLFSNNSAIYDGGAIVADGRNYFFNNTFISNNAFQGNGGAVYSQGIIINGLDVSDSRFINNSAKLNGGGIYIYDSYLNLSNSIFSGNGEAIYEVFSRQTILNNNTFDDDIYLNNTDYESNMFNKGIDFSIITNDINASDLPSRFDLRDWGWVTPVKNQGSMGSCWAFAASAAFESAFLKATGIELDISENNMQNLLLRYSKYGSNYLSEGGDPNIATQYFISWLGVVLDSNDTYDEYGKLSHLFNNTIHVQDTIFFPSTEYGEVSRDTIKRAVMDYGALFVAFCTKGLVFYDEYSSYYCDVERGADHEVALVGWDDNFPATHFWTEAPGDGAWICKNSWGTDWGEDGYFYISYYDKSFNTRGGIFGISFENNITYDKNYQTDLGGKLDYDTNIIKYYNNYQSSGNDFLAAVGTFFKTDNINYTLDLFVNDDLKLSQNGTSSHSGFSTVKLNEYIPVKKGDNFTIMVTGNYAPLLKNSVHKFQENTSFAYFDGKMNDLSFRHLTNILKVYALENPIISDDLVKIYKNDSYFIVDVGEADVCVNFEINGIKYYRTTNENGTAKMAINLNPGNYTVKTRYCDAAVENTVTVLPTLMANNLIKYFGNESHFYVKLIDGACRPVSGVNITMNINGVFYNRTTDENGSAKLNIWLNPGDYILTACDPLTGLMMSYNITVLDVLNASDLNMTYLDGSQFEVSVLDGRGNKLANATVTFNINGVFYTGQSDSNGTVRLNITLMPGEYIITSQYGEARISNKITIAKDELG